jgi:hypothetical protein
MSKDEFLTVYRRMTCKHFHNSNSQAVPVGAFVEYISPFRFRYEGNEYRLGMISEDEVREQTKRAEDSLLYWRNFKSKCGLM